MNKHKVLVFGVVLLTVTLLGFPVRTRFVVTAVQSVDLFASYLPLFGFFFFVWLLAILSLLNAHAKDPLASEWYSFLTLVVLVTVFLGFWVLTTSHGRHADEWYTIAQAQSVADLGRVEPSLYGYLSYPGTHILAAVSSMAMGTDLVTVRRIILLVSVTTLTASVFLWERKTVGGRIGTSLATVLFFIANPIVTKSYVLFPGHFGLVLLVSYLAYVYGMQSLNKRVAASYLLSGLTYFALTVTHFMSSLFVLLVSWAMVVLGRRNRLVVTQHALTMTIIFLSWQVYQIYAAQSFAHLGRSFLEKLSQGGLYFGSILSLGGSNLGGGVPLWARFTMSVWILSVYFLGSLVILAAAFHIRRTSYLERVEVAGLLTVGGISLLGSITSPGGLQLIRAIQWIPIFTTSALVRRSIPRPLTSVIGLGLITLLAFPSFLYYNNNVALDSFYHYDVLSAQTLRKAVQVLSNPPTVFGSVFARPVYLPVVAEIRTEPEYAYFRDEGDMFRSLDGLVEEFLRTRPGIFVFSERIRGQYARLYGIGVQDERWYFLGRLEGSTRMYDSGFVRMFWNDQDTSLASLTQ